MLRPVQGLLAGGNDAFVTRLSSAGNALVYSTSVGGTGDDLGATGSNGIAVDDGATCTGHVSVCVPHDRGCGRRHDHRADCTDEGQIYDSLSPPRP